MSRNDWEHGTITLPTAAVPVVKKALRDWSNRLHDEVRTEAIRLHKDVAKGTRVHDTYTQRLHAARYGTAANGYRTALHSTRTDRDAFVTTIALEVLDRMLWAVTREHKAPHQPTVTDVNRVVPKMTNRDNTFPVLNTDGSDEATIAFTGREVTWSVGENNRAVEHANAAPLALVFFAALTKVTWTRGTGGEIVGNDEYNEDSRDSGGGANYITKTYGPLGDEARITDHMRRGFSRKQAKEMIEAVNRPTRRYGW